MQDLGTLEVTFLIASERTCVGEETHVLWLRFLHVRAKLDLGDTAARQGLPLAFRMPTCMEENFPAC
jgi:hypothetical protein